MENLELNQTAELNPTDLAKQDLANLIAEIEDDKYLISEQLGNDINKELAENTAGVVNILDKYLVA